LGVSFGLLPAESEEFKVEATNCLSHNPVRVSVYDSLSVSAICNE